MDLSKLIPEEVVPESSPQMSKEEYAAAKK